MPSSWATRRASSWASGEQQLRLCSKPSPPSGWSRIQTPITSSPVALASGQGVPPPPSSRRRRSWRQPRVHQAVRPRAGPARRRASARPRPDDAHRFVDLVARGAASRVSRAPRGRAPARSPCQQQWLGSADPVVQALPVLASTPSRSSAAPGRPLDAGDQQLACAAAARSGAPVVATRQVARAGQHRSRSPASRAFSASAPRDPPAQLQRSREADDAGHVLGPGAPLPLLRAACICGKVPCPAARTGRHSLRSIQLCAPGSAGRRRAGHVERQKAAAWTHRCGR